MKINLMTHREFVWKVLGLDIFQNGRNRFIQFNEAIQSFVHIRKLSKQTESSAKEVNFGLLV